MKELWFWRGLSAVAIVAFLATSWSRSVESPPVTRHAAEAVDARPLQPRPGEPRDGKPRGRRGFPGDAPHAPPRPVSEAAATMPDVSSIPPEVLEVARAQVRAEDRARREARSEQHYDDLLDTVDTFGDDHDLAPAQRQALADAVTAMHERIRALRDAPTADGAGFGDRHEGFRDAFEQLDQDVRAAVGDDLADQFHEVARPPGHGGPPDGAGGPPERFTRPR